MNNKLIYNIHLLSLKLTLLWKELILLLKIANIYVFYLIK